ncbi:MAG: uncharacterized membrane protein YjjP (DUF1212 family) [Planctomycetota bacterium]|jgi:uncharacterized membrane protein YjjP (DUF1212 family)
MSTPTLHPGGPGSILEDSPGPHKPKDAFLLRLVELLHAYGTPSFRIERVMKTVSRGIGVEASFLAAPTAILVSLGTGVERAVHLIRGDNGELDLGKLVEFDEVMEEVEHHRISPTDGLDRLEQIAAAPSRYRRRVTALGFGFASGTASIFFGGGPADFVASMIVAMSIFLMGHFLPRRDDTIGFFEPLSAFLAAFSGSLLAAWGGGQLGVDSRIVTLASLIILLPGLSLTVGLSELATKHLISGMARVAGAGAVFLTLVFGVAMGWRLGDAACAKLGWLVDPALMAPLLRAWPEALQGSMPWISAAVAPFAFGVLMQARPRELGIIYVASVLGYGAAVLGNDSLGPDIGPFLGALVVGLVSNLYARAANRPALVPLTPGILMLVPGSLGFRSLTSFLEADALHGMSWAFQTGMVAVSLVGGLLASNMVLPPRRSM